MKRDGMKYLLIIVLLVASGFVAGCTGESKEKVSPVITSAVVTAPAIPPIQTQKPGTVTTMVTTRTVPAPTKTPAPTIAPSKPVASPVTVNGTSGKILRFHTDAPGIVKFTILYEGGTPDDSREGCAKDDRASIRLAGASIDTSLYNGLATETYTGTTTFNLISPGSYSLTTRGCYDWKVAIDNA
jgi:hypothetical protein